ncbi:SDR family oxidoreductase [Ascoidea rubescens DSM 1968]|uniref:Carbonyl reductase n=1 Tax=Ascoidea rubescens DSM 1968 TaxID=1344418 RepID=A0A1D2VN90_9ASCO|nr:carbonyl reductase [Ascoidea rubescens DSM 1968]ODV63059.1 carbonyl reductase [Ascoidea rubescens DSM 1968]
MTTSNTQRLETLASQISPLPANPPALKPHILDLFSLRGKVASITGSSSGIGYCIAESFAQAGADVAIWYNSSPAAVEKASRLSKLYNVKCRAYKCPINDSALVSQTIQQQLQDFGGKIDIFVANAGVAWTQGPLIDVNSDDPWHNLIDLDLNGVYYCAKAIGRIFQQQHSGSLIITSSISAHIVNIPQKQACYNAAKAAVLHLAKSLAVEWAAFNARVNTVSPGYIQTEITDFASTDLKQKWWTYIPAGREGLPKELAGAYLYLASDASTYTTGSDIIVDGGYCCT